MRIAYNEFLYTVQVLLLCLQASNVIYARYGIYVSYKFAPLQVYDKPVRVALHVLGTLQAFLQTNRSSIANFKFIPLHCGLPIHPIEPTELFPNIYIVLCESTT